MKKLFKGCYPLTKLRKRIDEMSEEKISKELENIKKLLILHLIKSGATPREIRNILKMSGTNFKKIVKTKNLRKYSMS